MKLSSRFLLDGLYVVAGAFLTVAAMAWSAGTAGWTAFGVSAAVAVPASSHRSMARPPTTRTAFSPRRPMLPLLPAGGGSGHQSNSFTRMLR